MPDDLPVIVGALRVGDGRPPFGIPADETPVLSWQLFGRRRGVRQTAYQIQVATDRQELVAGSPDVWDSGRVVSDCNTWVLYRGPSLEPERTYHWRVRVWDESESVSTFSEPGSWRMGRTPGWTAAWIGLPDTLAVPDTAPHGRIIDGPPPAMLRGRVASSRRPTRAWMNVTALGLYEVSVNGCNVARGLELLRPGWTDYDVRVQYQSYDITSQLMLGDNAIEAVVADGWYAGHIGSFGRQHYGDRPRFSAEICIEFADGTTDRHLTDGSWEATTGTVRYSDLLMGEHQDRRRTVPDRWHPVDLWANAPVAVVPQEGPSVVVTEVRGVADQLTPAPGVWIYDIGQNLAGRVRLHVRGRRGTTVRVRHAEALEPDGQLYTGNLRTAAQTDSYVLHGGALEELSPRFTYHGFRYVEVTAEGPVEIDHVEVDVIGADVDSTGTFDCSSPLLRQLQHNIVSSQRSNLVSVPTDCPQRDERLGWTGDVTVFAPTAAFNMDVLGFFRKWLRDLDDARAPSGAIPDVAPHFGSLGCGTSAWGDVVTFLPWALYQHYGDARPIRDHWPMIEGWIEYLVKHSDGLVRPDEGYGDWVSFDDATPKSLIGTAFFARSVELAARMAQAIVHDDAAHYRQLHAQVRTAFQHAFVGADGHVTGNSQTAYSLALAFDLLPERSVRDSVARLVERIAAADDHLSTGFLGTAFVLPVLSDHGHLDLAYRIALQDTLPSWGYAIRHGATTVWERWDSWTEDGGFYDPWMNSFNHFALGSVGEWLYRYVGGIDTDDEAPGYRHAIIRPRPGGGLSRARASLETPLGQLACSWHVNDHVIRTSVVVPPNGRATVFVPTSDPSEVLESAGQLDDRFEPAQIRRDGDLVSVEVPAGRYTFTAPWYPAHSSTARTVGNPKRDRAGVR